MMVFATLLETAIPEITGQIVDTLFSANRLKMKHFLILLSYFQSLH